ncbi:MAG: hypothetical protein ABIB98_03570 [bacterium]
MLKLVRNKIIYTLKTEIYHVFAALVAFMVVYILFRDVWYGILAIAIAFFVDVDHLLDYFFAEGFRIDIKSFLSGEFFKKGKRVVIIFHGWEYVLIFLLIFMFTRNPIFAVFSIALFAHYTVDLFTNHCVHKYGYFLTFRLKHKFDFDKILSDKDPNL